MTLGQEFHAFGAQLDAEIKGLRYCEAYLYEINMGATAIGTGITASPGYAEKCAAHLAEITGKPLVMHPELIAATSSMQGFVMYSSALKSMAVALSKIASDLIFLENSNRAFTRSPNSLNYAVSLAGGRHSKPAWIWDFTTSGPSVKWSSASASLPAGLPLSFGWMVTVTVLESAVPSVAW